MGPAPHRDGMLHHDGITWLIYAVYAAFGWFLYGFTPSVLLLRDEEHVTDAVAALHGTGYAVGIVVAGALAARLVESTGRDRGFWIFVAMLATGIVAYVASPAVPLTVAAAVAMGVGGSGLLAVASAALATHHGEAGPAAITEANALAAGFGLVAPLAVAGGMHVGYGWRPALALPVVVLAALFVCRRRFAASLDATSTDATGPDALSTNALSTDALSTDATGPGAARHHADGSGDRRLGRAYWLSWGFLVLCTGIEFCLTLWSGQFLHDRLGLASSTAATGVTAIVAGLAVGRVAGARLSHRLGIDTLLAGALAVNLAGFALFWTAQTPWAGFAGLAVCGLGIALQYPMGMGRAISLVAGAAQADRAAAWLTLGTGIAIGAAPFLLGFLADALTITWAFLIVPGLIGGASVMLALAHRKPAAVPAIVAAGPAPEVAAQR